MTDTSPQIQPSPPAAAEQSQETVPLTAEHLLTNRRHEPANGWRRLVWQLSGGRIVPGESATEIERRTLMAQAQTPVASGHHRIAVMSLKGGVGKTTTTVALGNTLASLRGDRVIAIDANPDRGTLGIKVKSETAATIRTLLAEAPHIVRYADARAFTSQSSARLEVLASDTDPAVSEAFNAEDYRTVAGLIERYYSICITDCGTGLLHGAMGATLELADQIVLVTLVAVDGASSASATLDWLTAHGYADLVKNAIVVLNAVEAKSDVDVELLERHFNSRCRAVIRVPYDPHLKEGAEVDLVRLQSTTRGAYLRLAAAAGQAFGVRPDRSH
ncbi:MinD/ParA family ATP-binding protein [Streptosporangium sp. NBC_01756]|uniref:MinD/ParA family ATP-binding protein n=1 Tax=Streptosporangium sp. NBC_01756 TaxID=2975950 RepID=UPI002DDC637D|nr:MinD/ParA family protein [Streptosporangium sp. NBC_01756]WSC90117.1 MinD/ParA family protein [Streptosporangium sp. NBC_01756]